MGATSHSPRWKTLLAFGIIYLCGDRLLCDSRGVSEVPHFFSAPCGSWPGLLVYGWAIMRGETAPSGPNGYRCFCWRFLSSLSTMAALLAEQRVPSGIAAVILATIPAFMALAEIVILRTQRLTVRLPRPAGRNGGVAILMIRQLILKDW